MTMTQPRQPDGRVSPVHIRWCIRRDMPDVLRISSAGLGHLPSRIARELDWDEQRYLTFLRQRNMVGMVAERDDRIVGFMIYALHKSNLELVRLCVAPDHRRRGIGMQMIAKLMGKLNTTRRTTLETWVVEDDLPLQLFLRECGMRAVGLLAGHDAPVDRDWLHFMYRQRGESLPARLTQLQSTGN